MTTIDTLTEEAETVDETAAQMSRSNYAASQRAVAEATGSPVQRSTHPTVVAPGMVAAERFKAVINGARAQAAKAEELSRLLIISIDEGDLVAHDTSTGSVERVTFALMDSICETVQVEVPGKMGPRKIPVKTTITMFADHQALRAMMKLARKNPNNMNTRLDRVIDVCSSLPMSQLFPVLTRALSHRFYLQANLDTNSIGDWATAFRLGALSKQDALAALAFQTIRSTEPDNSEPDGSLLQFSRSETFLSKSASFRGTTSDVSAFGSITSLTDEWAHYRDLDPKLIPENIAGSSVFSGALLSVSGEASMIRMDTAPKLKSEESVIILRESDGEKIRECHIDSIRLDDDRIVLKLKRRIASSTDRVILVKIPFRGSFKRPFASPWSSGKFSPTEGMVERNITVDIPQRSMPLDILIAGQH